MAADAPPVTHTTVLKHSGNSDYGLSSFFFHRGSFEDVDSLHASCPMPVVLYKSRKLRRIDIGHRKTLIPRYNPVRTRARSLQANCTEVFHALLQKAVQYTVGFWVRSVGPLFESRQTYIWTSSTTQRCSPDSRNVEWIGTSVESALNPLHMYTYTHIRCRSTAPRYASAERRRRPS